MGATRRTRTALAAAVAVLAGVAGPSAARADIGVPGPSFAPLGGSPTQTKPESKAWFADGAWWTTLYVPAVGAHRIHRLAGAAGPWVDTGTTVDARNGAKTDVLWHAASNRLYVASHEFSENNTDAAPGDEGRLSRFSYDPATDGYRLDDGFPVSINGAHSESLVIDMDSTGTLWATWTQNRQVIVSHSAGSDRVWVNPFVVPGSTPLAADHDDLSSLVAFGGNRIGVMWSNQADGRFWFATHDDGAGDGTWATAPISGLSVLSDDHVSLRADAAGRVFAAVKTSERTPGPRPLVLLLRRNTNGTWDDATFGIGNDSHTRPMVVLQEPGARAFVMATCPQPPSIDGQTGGDICQKSTPTSSLGFGGGIGAPIMSTTGIAELNDATSTKQSVSSATGLLVLANNDNDFVDRYWHSFQALSGAPPAPVRAEFTAASAVTGDAPLTVRFADASTGGPTSRFWSFGDFGTSTARNPTHTYTRPGTYTVSLAVAGVTTANTRTRPALVTVTGQGPPEPGGGSGGSGGGATPPGGTTPRRDVAGTSSQSRRLRVRMLKRNLRGGRVRLYGSVSPRLTGVRVVLQRRSSTGRWSNLRSARLRTLSRTRSRFAFVVKRLSKTVGYRIVVPARGSRTRAQGATLVVKRRG